MAPNGSKSCSRTENFLWWMMITAENRYDGHCCAMIMTENHYDGHWWVVIMTGNPYDGDDHLRRRQMLHHPLLWRLDPGTHLEVLRGRQRGQWRYYDECLYIGILVYTVSRSPFYNYTAFLLSVVNRVGIASAILRIICAHFTCADRCPNRPQLRTQPTLTQIPKRML